ncbi:MULTISPECIES: sodium:solute symporter family protein [unclassified Phycicoccus]|uniref:sodium:solute symporter family protein n=1 Tax=unclassified Phycicoccus TaxID=2637926 RepID=UPI000702E42D|nr:MULTISPECIES: sodium:solute symporter family protein [unclassified Phycicoccus]KQU65408.1 Na+/galactose cotransporter [Phycicoccus sp. Root101]KQZ89467.1 Na+/galactose cotransporter [Phycicoccus sp. Root563]
MSHLSLAVPAATTLIDANWLDYLLVVIYFGFVLGIGFMARRSVSDSIDFFLSGRSLPAWVTGLAFISANLGAVEIMGMSANGAEIGLPTVHYFWVGAIPAMLFLGVVMMPFYYGSKVRSVPEFMFRRFGTGAHLVNAISFAVAQLLIAGVNLYLLGSIVHALLGWPLWVALIVAAAIVLSYITLGGLSAAIYNEVLQFFVIVASLLPLTLIGLHRVGGYGGLKDKIAAFAESAPAAAKVAPAAQQLESWPGQALSGFSSSFLSVIGIVFGLGFVLSFGYWTTNFVEVQRAMASKSISAARKTPIIGAFPKMFVPFIVILPGMVSAVLVKEMIDLKGGGTPAGGASGEGVKYNDALLLLMRDVLPNGLLGLAIAGLLAAFMAGMAANISAFNTVFSYDLWQRYIRKDHSDDYYLRIGRLATVAATVIAIFTATIASSFSNVMDYLQTLFGFFNAPLFATFILGMFWKRMTATAGWVGLSSGTISAVVVAFLSEDAFGSASLGVLGLSGQGASFVAASTAFVVDIVVSVLVTMVTEPKPASELKGLVYSETPKEDLRDPEEASQPWYQRTMPLAGIALLMVLVLNFAF